MLIPISMLHLRHFHVVAVVSLFVVVVVLVDDDIF